MEEEYDFENEFNDTHDTRKKIQQTEHQKNKIKETLKKMDENMTQPQTSCGRIFSGAGFASNPEKIIFKDFELGVTAIITIDLINISYSFNTFKLLPLDDEIIDFFEIDFKPCGRIPAGISTPMTLKFTPMVDKDYFSNLKLLSETGMVLIPIECLSKKCVINVSNETIDFGEVILGQEIKKDLNIENKGALSCTFRFLDQDGNSFSHKEFTENEKTVDKQAYTEEDKENEAKTKKKYFDFIEGPVIRNKNSFFEEMELKKDSSGVYNADSHRIIKKYFTKQLNFPTKGNLDLYSKKSLPFVLNSKYVGKYEFRTIMSIEYKNKVEHREIFIKFTIVDLPLYTDQKIYHLEHLIEDNTFREKIILHNTSNVSYKLQIYNHPDLNQFIEINPNLGYVQSNSSFDIWIKLKMKNSIHSLDNFFKAERKNEFNFPLKITVTNIKIPIIATLNFSLTNDNISIKDSLLNFEKCFIDECNTMQISMQNNSLQIMKYGFIMLPKEISAKNNIDTLLNGEGISCDIAYDATDNYLGHREGDIFCKVITNDITVKNRKLKYHIELISPEIEIRPKKILFPVLPSGEKKSLRLILKNISDKDNFICEWLTPPFCVSGFTIMPKVFELTKSSYITCIVEYKSEFRPYGPFSFENVEKEIGRQLSMEFIEQEDKNGLENGNGSSSGYANPFLEDRVKKEVENAFSQNPDSIVDKKKKVGQEKKELPVKKFEVKKDKKLIDEEEKKKRDEDEKISKDNEDKRNKRIQQFDREKELKLFGGEIFSFEDSEGKSEHSKFSIPLCYKTITNSIQQFKTTFIEVSTACIEKTLIFEKNEIDFGDVSVQNGKTVNLILHNKSDKNADIKIKPLIVSNCFQLVNSVRLIPPNSSFNFILEFFPQKDITYFDEFCVYTEDTQTTLRLKGRGVQPEISLNVEGGILFIGNVCTNNTAEKQMEITNKSSFDLHYEIVTLKSGKKNRSGFKPFSFIPYKGNIKANSKIPIKVSFVGDHQDFLNFYELILVNVPNQKTPNYVFIYASCWNRQAYWKEFSTPTFPDEKFFDKAIEQDYFVEPLKVKSNSLGSNNDKIVLEFSKNTSGENPTEASYKQKLIIGNCRLNEIKNEKTVNFEIIMPKDDNSSYFNCEMPKGAILAASEVVVPFTLKKPSKDPYLKDIDCLNNIGMWITYKCELRINGGYTSEKAQDNTTSEIILRAYVENL